MIRKVRQPGKRLIALHVRQRGLENLPASSAYFRTDPELYRSWLKANRSILDNAVLYIASDTADAVAHFAEFGPVSSRDVGWGMPVLPYLPDWCVCGDADVLVIPNSTFSLTAAMLNEKAEQFLRVQRGRERLVLGR